MEELVNCSLCPRQCNANRNNAIKGYCNASAEINISSVCVHHGEEPAISGKNGILNIFFSRCNLKCIYCQNHQISQHNATVIEAEYDTVSLIEKIKTHLNSGIHAVGFVSPSHMVPQVISIIHSLYDQGKNPVFVYNSNGYDSVETLKLFEGLIDVYLPDMKYMDKYLAKEYSDAENYPETASAAIREMYRQKGSAIEFDNEGRAISGLIIRHLVLPGQVENSKKVLEFIARECSPQIWISLMSQYFPTDAVKNHPVLNRKIGAEEYEAVVAELERLGFENGWIQEAESNEVYRPDFSKDNPFD